VDVEAAVDLDVPPATVFAELKDLDGYPEWLSIVQEAKPAGPGPAWLVDLGAGVGPLRLAKTLRMVRTVTEAPRRLRFERVELDGRAHSEWILSAGIDGTATTRLTMQLHYGGTLRLPFVELALAEEIRRAGPRLQRFLDRTG
jgi:uncharacterized protein YndB with AHSA1/START domain